MKDLSADDPMELIGQLFPVESEIEADREMARCFAEEYALMGFTAIDVGRLFESPLYAAPHSILARQGPDFVRAIIGRVFGAAS